MPLVVRLGDRCTGHGCWPSRPNIQASPDVFVNDLGWHRVGDAWATHCCPPPCHGGVLAQGSPDVFINGRAGGRMGDPVSCGSYCLQHSPDVNCNE